MIDKLQLIAEIKRLVGKANTEQALERLVEALEKAGSSLSEDAIKAQSQFQKTQRDEARGSISFENAKMSYSQVDDQIFNILDVLEREAKRMASPPGPGKKIALWGGGALLVVLIASLLIFNNKKEEPDVEPNVVGTNCPTFDSTSVFKVLIFPFLPRDRDEGKSKSENITKSILDKLVTLSAKLSVNSSVMRYEISYDTDEEYNNYPSTMAAAQALGSSCRPDLIICGSTEKEASGGINTMLNYKFLNSRFTNLKLNITENSVFDTITSGSSILTENSFLTADIEAAMKILFGMIANETGNTGAAIEELANLRTSDSLSTLLAGMTLAGSYVAEGQKDKAAMEYEKALSAHPGYWLALNNQGALSYESGDNAKAIEYYDKLVDNLSKQPRRDTSSRLADAITARGRVFLKAEVLDKAEEDFKTVRRMKPSDNKVRQLEQEVSQQKAEKQEQKTQAEASLRVNPRDTKALEVKATADKALGNTRESIVAAEAAVKNNSTNPEVFSILAEEKAKNNDTKGLQKIVKRANQAGVPTHEILKNSDAPVLQRKLRSTGKN